VGVEASLTRLAPHLHYVCHELKSDLPRYLLRVGGAMETRTLSSSLVADGRSGDAESKCRENLEHTAVRCSHQNPRSGKAGFVVRFRDGGQGCIVLDAMPR
jgi:hypothetical protein